MIQTVRPVVNALLAASGRFGLADSDRANKYGKSVIIFNSLDIASTWLGIDPLKARELMDSIGGQSLQ